MDCSRRDSGQAGIGLVDGVCFLAWAPWPAWRWLRWSFLPLWSDWQRVFGCVRRGALNQLSRTPANLLFLVSLPWVPMFPFARGRLAGPPPCFTRSLVGIWTYALLSNLRLVLTGYASGLRRGACPGCAVGVAADRSDATPRELNATAGWRCRSWARWRCSTSWHRSSYPIRFSTNRASRVQTAVGPVRVPQATRRRLVHWQPLSINTSRPGAPIFAAGWGAQWYLLSNRPNPTAFDVVLLGMGISGPEAASLERALLRKLPQPLFYPEPGNCEADTSDAPGAAQRDAAADTPKPAGLVADA